MQKLATKHYGPIATNDFIIFSDDRPLYAKSLLPLHQNKNKMPSASKLTELVLVWCGGLVIHDKEDRALRKKNIKFHIESDDYFGTLATVIDLIRQEKEKIEKRQNKILKDLKDDLVYLQKNYKITKKK